MRTIVQKDFDPLQIVVKDNGESVQLVMSTSEVSHAVPVEEHSELCSEDNYNPLRVSDKPNCAVCGDKGAYHRYEHSSFTIHPECRPDLRDRIKSVLDNNSANVISSVV